MANGVRHGLGQGGGIKDKNGAGDCRHDQHHDHEQFGPAHPFKPRPQDKRGFDNAQKHGRAAAQPNDAADP